MEESSRWIWGQPAYFVTLEPRPLSPIGELQVMVADRQRQLVDLTGASEPRRVSQIDPGCVKTQALNLRVENPS